MRGKYYGPNMSADVRFQRFFRRWDHDPMAAPDVGPAASDAAPSSDATTVTDASNDAAPVDAVAATNTLTSNNTIVTAGDTVTIGTKVYTFQSSLTNVDGNVKIGIHIAAPGLGIKPDDAVDKMARARMSTVYMPGDKITMLPDEVVNAFTLAEGKTCPALSLYATLDTADWSVLATETRAELVPIARNLRHNDLDELVNEETLASGAGDYPHKAELALLWQWAHPSVAPAP